MKVLHVVTGLASGGAERQLHLLLKHLPERHSCEVAVLTNPGTVAAALRADGFTVHDLAMRGNRDVAVLPRLARLIRAGGHQAVHTHLYRAGLYGRLAARLAGVRPVVATEHSLHPGVIEGRPATRGVRALYLAAERLGTVTVAVSGQVATTLADWGCPRTGYTCCRTASRRGGISCRRRWARPCGPNSACPPGRSWWAGWAGWCPGSASGCSSTRWPRCATGPARATRGCCWSAPARSGRHSPP
ncbi:hypothetical protein GCM10025734_60960 [Kitasatospora paranensis]